MIHSEDDWQTTIRRTDVRHTDKHTLFGFAYPEKNVGTTSLTYMHLHGAAALRYPYRSCIHREVATAYVMRKRDGEKKGNIDGVGKRV